MSSSTETELDMDRNDLLPSKISSLPTNSITPHDQATNEPTKQSLKTHLKFSVESILRSSPQKHQENEEETDDEDIDVVESDVEATRTDNLRTFGRSMFLEMFQQHASNFNFVGQQTHLGDPSPVPTPNFLNERNNFFNLHQRRHHHYAGKKN